MFRPALLFACAALPLCAQAVAPTVRTPCGVAGFVDGTTAPDAWTPVGVATTAGAAWMRVWCLPWDLPPGAALRFTGPADDVAVEFDAAAWRAWGYSSPYFNGDAIVVELRAPAGTTAAFVASASDSGLAPIGVPAPDSVCGVDDRAPFVEPRVGRVLAPLGFALCSGALVGANDVFLTAGHCVAGGSGLVVEFDPPPSTAAGAIQHPPPSKQYTLNWPSVAYDDFGVGNDWAAFRLQPNAATGAGASSAQGFFAVAGTPSAVGATMRVAGCGADAGVDNFALQSATGALVLVGGPTGSEIRYAVDTDAGNSGSPVVDVATGAVVGVHTHDGCTFGTSNRGTAAFHVALQAQLAALAVPAPPTFAIDVVQLGPGTPLTLEVTHAPPSAELFNLISFVPRVPLGSGPFFGLDAGGGEIFQFFALPLGTEPFHVPADAAGHYALTLPTTGTLGPFSGDLVSVAFVPGAGFFGFLAASVATNATFTL